MTITQAIPCVKDGYRVRRAIWRYGLWLEMNYLSLHLAVVGDRTQPYTLTLDDLVADDWHVNEPCNPPDRGAFHTTPCAERGRGHISFLNDDRTEWVCIDCGHTSSYAR